MKTEKYYDVGCEECGRHMSTDFQTGMFRTKPGAERRAKEEGFRISGGRTLCPICVVELRAKRKSIGK